MHTYTRIKTCIGFPKFTDKNAIILLGSSWIDMVVLDVRYTALLDKKV